MKFQGDGNFINLARADPAKLVAVKNGQKGQRLCSIGGGAGGNTVSSLCISLVQLTECRIVYPTTTRGGQIIKEISGLHHSVENERMQACCCVVFGVPMMQAPIRDGVLTFGTRLERPSTHLRVSIHVRPLIITFFPDTSKVGMSTGLTSPIKPKTHLITDLSQAHDWVKYSDDSRLHQTQPVIDI